MVSLHREDSLPFPHLAVNIVSSSVQMVYLHKEHSLPFPHLADKIFSSSVQKVPLHREDSLHFYVWRHYFSEDHAFRLISALLYSN